MKTNLINYDNFVDTQAKVDVLLGSTSVNIQQFISFSQGDIITLNKQAGHGGDIYVNDRIIGTGDITVLNERLAVRVQDTMNPDKVIKYFFEEQEI